MVLIEILYDFLLLSIAKRVRYWDSEILILGIDQKFVEEELLDYLVGHSDADLISALTNFKNIVVCLKVESFLAYKVVPLS